MPHLDALPAPVPLPHVQRLMLVLSRGACRGTHGQNAWYQIDSRGADEGRVVIGHVDQTTIIQTHLCVRVCVFVCVCVCVRVKCSGV